MKKILSFLLCLVLAGGMFAACGQGDGGEANSQSSLGGGTNEDGEPLGATLYELYGQVGPYIEACIIDKDTNTVQTDDGQTYSFTSDECLPNLGGMHFNAVGERLRFYYGGELQAQGNRLLGVASIPEDGRRDYVMYWVNTLYEKLAELEDPLIIRPAEAMRVVIAYLGYENMQAVPNGAGDINYSNGEILVYCSYIELQGIDFCDDSEFTIMCRSVDVLNVIYYESLRVSMQTGEIHFYN
ncbi:hypothetical protein LJB77_00355 [Ruminococcaceae bacterium OttesenSCG-928-N02]|nr:hypothetical protein [Ruminococcaceae bacterium OttesenSCG-928-N02]